MSDGTYCYLRNGSEAGSHTGDRGRIGYRSNRADVSLYTHEDARLSRRWRMRDFGEVDPGNPTKRVVTLEATDTAVAGMAINPGDDDYWAYAPLMLTAAANGEVRLARVGGVWVPEENAKWIAETVEQPLAGGTPACVKLESWAFRGQRLGHERAKRVKGAIMPKLHGRLMIHARDASHDYWTDCLWWVEPAPEPIAARGAVSA